MEDWILYDAARYEAISWPYAEGWDEFLRSPRPLVNACEDFGRVGPCDGLSETPSVPPHLPRAIPRGRYRFAVYHDADWLFVLLEAEDGPFLVPSETLAAIPHLKGINPLYPTLVFMTPDQRFTVRFGLNGRAQPEVTTAPVAYGSRKEQPPPRPLRWSLQVVPTPAGDLSGWRIARADLADLFEATTARFSLSRMRFETLETVAWGSPTNWAPRPDEFGLLKLVEERRRPPWPLVRRVLMRYDPMSERARFTVRWEGIYQPDETTVRVYPDPSRVVPWLRWSFRLNGEQRLFPLQEESETTEFALTEGINCLDMASAGGPALRLFVEKRSGNRIWARDAGRSANFDDGALRKRMRSAAEATLRMFQERQARGANREYRGWETYRAASLGRMYQYLNRDPRLLEVVRAEAEYALSLQRPDGSFAGFHMARSGRPSVPWAGGAYDSGLAGELWVVAAWLLGEERFRRASERLLSAYRDYRIEFNYNFAAFALYHLVAHYRLTRDPRALEPALYYARHCVAVDLLPLGFHGGHNYYTCYGSIILRGLGQLCAVLPADDPYRARLRELCVRMANQVLSRQQSDGSFDARDRFFLGERWWSWGLFSVAFLLPPEEVARLDAALQRMLESPAPARGPGEGDPLVDGDLACYLAHREALLEGRPIDLLALV